MRPKSRAADRAGRRGQHRPRHLRFPGPAIRDPARRHGPLRRRAAQRDRSDARHPDAAADSGRRGARQRARHAEAAGDRAEQHAAARAGRHPVADRVQPADQLARRRPADLAGAARAAAGDRRASPAQLAQSIGNALGLDTFEINTAPDSGGGRAADHRPAGRAEPLREGGAGHRRAERRPTSSSSTSSPSGCGCGPTCCRARRTQQQLFQRAQGSGVDLLFFFSY